MPFDFRGGPRAALAPRGESSLNVPVETQSPAPAVCRSTFTPVGMRQMLPETPSPASSIVGNASARWTGCEFVTGFSALAYRAVSASRSVGLRRSGGYRGLDDED